MVIIGLVITLLSVNFIMIDLSITQILIFSLIIIVFSVIYMFIKTENAIRNKL